MAVVNHLKVLLVEDVAIDAELVLHELKKSGFSLTGKRVWTEADFREALTAFMPDIVISDFSMPAFDGLRALQLTRELAPDVPLIFLSGDFGDDRAVSTALKNGAADCLLKDDLARLGPAVEKAMRAARDRGDG